MIQTNKSNSNNTILVTLQNMFGKEEAKAQLIDPLKSYNFTLKKIM